MLYVRYCNKPDLFFPNVLTLYSCQTNDLMESSTSDNEEVESEWIPIVNSTQTLLSDSQVSFGTVSLT
jgi:hypothetical protein